MMIPTLKNLKSAAISCLLLFLVAFAAQGQGFSLTGKFLDKGNNEPLIGVNIVLVNQADTTRKMGLTSDVDGKFQFERLRPGNYKLMATYVGYQNFELPVVMARANQDLGNLSMEQAALQLEGVTVEATQIRAQQKGDTTDYNANAFKVNPDADAEQLVRKMPGVTVENGQVKAQGEDVRRVLVDGREFFGDDATLALRNLPAEAVERIQVFDRMSDQSQFSGFNDGNTEKTINIVTRGGGLRNAQFGKIYAGYGTDERYTAGGGISLFNGDSRISIIGLFNNVNQQNFSTQDLLGVTGANRGGGGGGGRGNFGGGGGGGGFGGFGGDSGNFLVGQQSGISSTNSIGFNYSDNWGKKVKVTGSYFFNNSNNDNNNILSRIYFLEENVRQFYDETSESESHNYNHRFNARIEYNIDSTNSIIITPRLNLQNYRSASLVNGENMYDNGTLVNQTENDNDSERMGYTFSNNILYRHRFAKAGRTFSIGFNTDFNDNDGNSSLYSLSQFYDSQDSSLITNQRTNTLSDGYTLSTNVNYTEPIGKKANLQFEYRPSINKNDSERETNDFDEITNGYTDLNTALSNKFDNEVITQRGGLSYRWRDEKLNFSFGANYQNVQLSSAQSFPLSLDVEKSFNNLLPNAMFEYRPNRNQSLRLFYRTSTNTPSISQLQNVINNSNPLQLSTGNPDLQQQFSNTVFIRYNLTNPTRAQTFFAFLSGTYNDNYIGTSTLIASKDTVLQDGITLFRGAQLSQPVNLGGNWNVRSFFTYGVPIKLFKSNLNFNAGFTYGRSPGLINNVQNESQTYNVNSGVVIGSNISQSLDFTISYSANYNIVENTLQPQLNNNYFYQLSTLRFNWLPWKKFVVSTDMTHSLYTGLGDDFNQDFLLWNAGLAYKFMKNNAGELRLSVFDLLKQNNSISRTVTETYVEDNINRVLTQYFMLTFTYNLRNFGLGGDMQGQQPGMNPWGGQRPPGNFPPRN
ncbi:MAG: outer membrane beta-barrel protein [Saprospiraceae bacterium]|nr:outer membrane beta-barrel protein [Saprospiraceae bacterium]